MNCRVCGSFAINHFLHGRDGSDGDLCDVCYWRKRAEIAMSFVGKDSRVMARDEIKTALWSPSDADLQAR